MTAREIWEGVLTELSKTNAPSMLLQDFNYFFNKAINQYINKRYNIYDINQQTTDDLRVLKASSALDVTPLENNSYDFTFGTNHKLFEATYEVFLPQDYLHLLNCICVYRVNKKWKCYNAGEHVSFAAKRLTSDSWSVIFDDFYNRPLPQRPYYYIHNVNTQTDLPTNPISNGVGTDLSFTSDIQKYKGWYQENSGSAPIAVYSNSANSITWYYDEECTRQVPDVNLSRLTNITFIGQQGSTTTPFPRTLTFKVGDSKKEISVVEKEAYVRYGNPQSIRMEIRYGHDNSIFTLEKVLIDYIKSPQTIRLTQEQVNLTEDTSQIMEFPDYVCHEIINELTMLVMENTADPRLQTNSVVNKSIAQPAQQQILQPQSQQA